MIYQAPRNLRIKKGAKVMFIKNDSEGRWVNGTIGEVTNCSDKKGRFLRVRLVMIYIKLKEKSGIKLNTFTMNIMMKWKKRLFHHLSSFQ
jgi:ATP-dependent exoDNAse (exonuclease V) alpha subunit